MDIKLMQTGMLIFLLALGFGALLKEEFKAGNLWVALPVALGLYGGIIAFVIGILLAIWG